MGDASILLFDGHCGLCNRSVDFILRKDTKGNFRFAALQSPAGAELLKSASALAGVTSMVLIEGGAVWVRSTAALRIARGLGPPWSLLWIFMLVPRALRDAVYDRVAQGRYRWFGRADVCRVPTAEERPRFLG